MTEAPHPAGVEMAYEPAPGAAGALLRAAREAAGLSIDMVSQQLKLAPRQVLALEDGDYEHLPGRTFVRGFTRNYARLLQLDVDSVMALLPQADSSPALDTPAIGSSTRPMGELPVAAGKRSPSWSRWAIPIALVALIGVAAVYEFKRPQESRPGEVRTAPAKSGGDPIAAPAGNGVPLPNPLAGSDVQPPADAAKGDAPAAPAATPGATPSVAQAAPGAEVASPAASQTGTAEATLTIAYRAAAWTEVRDRSGQVLYTGTAPAGTTQTLTGAPPFDLVLGNAMQTSVTWRGAPFDLNPHIQKNVARVRLQ